MKWDDDAYRYEKYLLLDGIISFSNEFLHKDPNLISLGDLTSFVDKFIDEYDEYKEKRC